jgi:enamine deaminase RidA (YjgF/YER057c/UK114 family)
MQRPVFVSTMLLALSMSIAAPQIVSGNNWNHGKGWDDDDDDDDDDGGGPPSSQKLKKTAVPNPAAPDFSAIFNWGLKLKNVNEVFLIAGHGAHDAQGQILYPDDPVAQTQYILDNFDTYLDDAGYQRKDIIRVEFTLTSDVTDAEFGQIMGLFADYFAPVNIKPAAGTLRYVDRLALPGMMVEYEIWCAK